MIFVVQRSLVHQDLEFATEIRDNDDHIDVLVRVLLCVQCIQDALRSENCMAQGDISGPNGRASCAFHVGACRRRA